MRRSSGALFATLYLLGVLLFVEACLQGFYYFNVGQALASPTGRPMYAANPYAGFFNKPHLALEHNTNEFRSRVHTNSAGFRVPRAGFEYTLENPAGVNRLLLLGPSFAFGWGVDYEDSFAARLQDLLGMQVINAGVPGLGAYSQFSWYESVGRQYRTALVVQIVYASMAVDRRPDDNTVDHEGNLLPVGLSSVDRLVSMAKNSALVFYAWSLLARADARPASTNDGGVRRLPVGHAFSTDEPAVKEALKYFSEFRAAVRASGAMPVIVFVPMSYMVHRGDIARWRHLGVSNVDEQLEFDREFCRYLASQDLMCINLAPALIDAAALSPERLYYWRDVHWTKRGNAVASLAVAEALKRYSLAWPPSPTAR